ncbi:MAG: hypothetical protein ACREO3_00335 [Arenimonas sp.]
MILFKPAAALLVLGLSGWLGVAVQAPLGAADLGTTDVQAKITTTTPASAVPDSESLRVAAQLAIRDRVRQDLDDPDAQVELPGIVVERSSLRSLEARGEGRVVLEGARAIPISVTAVYDLVDGNVEAVDYTAHPVEAVPGAVDHAVRAAIGRRIGERIAVDFQNQPVSFELLQVETVDYAKHRTRLQGNGVTDFGKEGVAYTPFVALLDKHTGELLELQYELLQDNASATQVAGR